MDLVFLAAAAALIGPLVRVAPLVTIAAGAVLVALAIRARARARRDAWLALVLCLVAFAGSALRARVAIGASERTIARLADHVPRPTRCELIGRVAMAPTRRGGAVRVVADVTSASCENAPLVDIAPFRVALSTERDDLARGDVIRSVAQIAQVERFWNDELGDPAIRIARTGIPRTGGALTIDVLTRGHGLGALIDRARAHVRRRIDATFEARASPMARALVLGESDLDADDDLAFRTSGLSHLLAVSGMHLVIVVLTFERVIALALRRVERWAGSFDVGRLAATAAIAGAWIYADFAGGSGSAVRAAWMLTVLLAAKAGARRTTGVRALGVSTLAAVLLDPLVVFDISFVLSLAATAGLLAFSTRFGEFFLGTADAKDSPESKEANERSRGATIPCAPLLAQLGPTLPLGGLFANVVAVPLGEVAALPLCLLHAVLSPFPNVERGSALAASGALLAVRAVARSCAALPWASFPVSPPTPAQTGTIAVAIVSCALPRLSRRTRLVVVCACAVIAIGAELLARERGAPRGVLRVTMLDVGQGDAILVDLPDGEALLIDAGGLVGSPIDVGTRVIAPVLRARRRRALSVAALSHPHPDHYGGLASGTDAVRVGAFWDTGQGEAEDSVGARAARIALESRGATVLRPATLCGTRELGGVTIEILAPCPRFDPDHGPNDNSLVMRIRYGRRSMLFVGDAERHEEAELLERHGARLAADVLKVGHHGSATSTSPEFLAAVRPAIALVSCGVRNRFGHPRAETLATLERNGVFVARTDRDGELVVETDGQALSLRTARSGAGALYTASDR